MPHYREISRTSRKAARSGYFPLNERQKIDLGWLLYRIHNRRHASDDVGRRYAVDFRIPSFLGRRHRRNMGWLPPRQIALTNSSRFQSLRTVNSRPPSKGRVIVRRRFIGLFTKSK